MTSGGEAAPSGALGSGSPRAVVPADVDEDEEAILFGRGAEGSDSEQGGPGSEAGLDGQELDADEQANLRQIAERVQVGGSLLPEVKPFDAFLSKLQANTVAAARRKPLGLLGEDPNAKFSQYADVFERVVEEDEALETDLVIEPAAREEEPAAAKAQGARAEPGAGAGSGAGAGVEAEAGPEAGPGAQAGSEFEDDPLLTETEEEEVEDEEAEQAREAVEGLVDDAAEESGGEEEGEEDEGGEDEVTDEEEEAAIRHELGLNSDGEPEEEEVLPAEEAAESESESSIESESEEEEEDGGANGFTWEREEPGLQGAEAEQGGKKKRRPKNEKVGRRVMDAAHGFVDVEAELSEDEEYQAQKDEDEDADGDADLKGLIGKGRHTARDVERAAKQHQKWLLQQDEKELDDVVDRVRRGYNRKLPGGLEEAGDAEGLEAARERLARGQEEYDFSGLKDLFRGGPQGPSIDDEEAGDEKAEALANLEAARKRKLLREQERAKIARTDSASAPGAAHPEAAAGAGTLPPFAARGENVGLREPHAAWGAPGAQESRRKAAIKPEQVATGAGHFIGLKRRSEDETEETPVRTEPLARGGSGAYVFQRVGQSGETASKMPPPSVTPSRRARRQNAGSLLPPTPTQPRVSQIASLLGAGARAGAQPQEAATVPKDMRKKLYGLLGKPRNTKAAAE